MNTGPTQPDGSVDEDVAATEDLLAEDGTGEPAPAPLTPLEEPADGIPDVVVDERRLMEAARALAAGTGPLAIDAERASGYRYGQRAYLVQLRREGSGTWLVDPIACPDLSPIAEAIVDVEWVLHAATQDLPCLAEVGLRPTRLFDTELGARLVGLPRVGLAAVVEHYLGLSLAKEHSAVDWSTRPLPEPWLRYAALDVEVLVEVRDHVAADLAAQGKTEWARQEFDALTRFTGPPPRVEPWRRTSGMHRVRNRRTAAIVRELWQERDALAVQRDVSPGRVLPDAALIELAVSAPRTAEDLPNGHPGRLARRNARTWLTAIARARHIEDRDLPLLTLKAEGPPPARSWADRDPVAAARLADARAALVAFAHERTVPVENVLSPDHLRRVLWSPPEPATEGSLAAAFTALGARPWQVEIAVPVTLSAILAHPDA